MREFLKYFTGLGYFEYEHSEENHVQRKKFDSQV